MRTKGRVSDLSQKGFSRPEPRPNAAGSAGPVIRLADHVPKTEPVIDDLQAWGSFDSIEDGVATGWAFLRGGATATVAIMADGSLVATVPANQARPDVASSGQSDGKQAVGFACRLPADLGGNSRRSTTHRITAHVTNTQTELPGVHEWRYQGPTLAAGHFSIRHGLVQGGFSLPPGHARPDAILLEEDGKTVLSLPPAFEEDNKPNSLAVASVQGRLPVKLRDGNTHKLTLRLANTNCFLRPNGSSHVLEFQAFIRGAVDRIKNGIASGWAYDTRNPADPVLVEVLDGDRVVASGRADQGRGDVGGLYPEGTRSGFTVTLPLALYDNGKHHLLFRCAGESIAPARTENGYEILQVDSAGTPAERIVGRVDSLDNTRVTGWVFETGSDRPLTVRIEVDGIDIGTVAANGFERRLAVEGRHGYHGFIWDFPAELMNGRARRVRVIPVGSTTALPAPAEIVTFPLTILPPGTNANARLLSDNVHHWHPRPTPADPNPCRLSIIVVNWNGAAYLQKMLASLARHALAFQYEIIVVDHGSTDASESVVQAWAPRLPLRWMQRAANYSFSQSNNFAAAQANGTMLLFANNDLEFPSDCITPALARFEDPELGILGFRLLEPVPSEHEWSLRDHHLAITFQPARLSSTRSAYLPYEVGAGAPPRHVDAVTIGAVTAALMMCRSADFHTLGGFSEAYSYGLEDVDLCLRARKLLQRRVICDRTLNAIHDRSATRSRKSAAATAAQPYSAAQALQNRSEFFRRHGRALARMILNEAVDGAATLARRPLRVTLAVTEASIHTAAGDYFTAMELAIALRDAFGWETMFVAHNQYDLADTDVLILMRHDYDLSKLIHAAPTLLIIAWVRNRVDQWCDGPHLPRCHLVFASSRRAIAELQARHGITAHLLPIATNPDRFQADLDDDARHGVVFTGNFWGHPRETVELAETGTPGMDLQIYGAGWARHPQLGPYWRGFRPYYELPAIYQQARIVLDDSHPVTKDWNSLNSRVFDALASGSLVLTNCRGGAKELFGDLLPSFETQAELRDLLSECAANPEAARLRAAALQQDVLKNHTYALRAQTVHGALRAFCAGTRRVSIKIGVPNMKEREYWGDYHFALGLQRALQRLGFWVRIDLLPEWNAGYGAGDDVAITLRGLSHHQPTPGVLNIMWLISHPDRITIDEMKTYDHVFVASDSFAARLRTRLGNQVSPLLQCTDPTLFYPLDKDEADEHPAGNPLFVGNTRGQNRLLVDWALQEQIPLELHGKGWGATPAAPWVKSDHIPNQRLRRHYAASSIVLGDHWPDMREEGFISNRLFDAACCGSLLAVDDVQGVRDVFGDLVTICRKPAELTAAVHEANQAGKSRKVRKALRALVLAHHTFDHRARTIADMIENLQ